MTNVNKEKRILTTAQFHFNQKFGLFRCERNFSLQLMYKKLLDLLKGIGQVIEIKVPLLVLTTNTNLVSPPYKPYN